MKISISSDGTRMGTKCLVDNKEPKNMTDMHFSCYGGNDNVYFNYSTEHVMDKDAGLVKRETYFLADKYHMDMMGKDGRYVGKASINGGPELNLYRIESIIKK